MKLVHAELQNSVVFQASEVLGHVSLNESKHPGIQMEWKGGDGLYVTTPKLRARKRIGFVPAANVRNLEFEAAEEATKEKAKIKVV